MKEWNKQEQIIVTVAFLCSIFFPAINIKLIGLTIVFSSIWLGMIIQMNKEVKK